MRGFALIISRKTHVSMIYLAGSNELVFRKDGFRATNLFKPIYDRNTASIKLGLFVFEEINDSPQD
jgi:hypothetical protein